MRSGRPDGEAEYRSTVERAMEELRLKTGAHQAAWRIGEADWSDMEKNTQTGRPASRKSQ